MSATTKTAAVAALVPIDHEGVIYRRGQLLNVAPGLAVSLLDRAVAQIPGAPVEPAHHRMSAANATYAVEPTGGPLPLPAGPVEITLRRAGAYTELGGHYCAAGSRWLVAPSVARELRQTGDDQ